MERQQDSQQKRLLKLASPRMRGGDVENLQRHLKALGYTITDKETQLEAVLIRAAVGCGWPYGVRRYNGSGVNSYWYQAKILLKV